MRKTIGIIVVILSVGATACAQDETLEARQSRSQAAFHASLSQLVRSLDEKKLEREAGIVRDWIIDRDPGQQYAFQPQPFDCISRENRDAAWLGEFNQLRHARADLLFELATEAVNQKKSALAFALVHEVLHENPSHADARRILGYRFTEENGWHRPAREIKTRQSTSRHRLMNWPAKSWSLAESAHYQIATRGDQESAELMLQRLEIWHELWHQVFFDYWSNDGMIAEWFAGKSTYRPKSRKYKIVFFENKETYVAELLRLGVQGVERSTGYYSDTERTCFFYAGDESLQATWLQEQAHQLFQESVATRKDPTTDGYIWAVEGIAMYFETMVERSGYVEFGGFATSHLQFARLRVNREGFYIPFQQFQVIGRTKFQTDENAGALYSQAAGLAQFFMVAENGRYRRAFIDFVRDVYSRRARPTTIEKLTGLSAEQVDQAYKNSLNVTADEIDRLDRLPRTISELALGDSAVTSNDLACLPEYQKLKWLQLSHSKIDDRALVHVAKLPNLTQLFLDTTSITDEGAAHLAGMHRLLELDVATTDITDEGLAAIGRLKNLKVLWLTNTRVTDEGLQHLNGLQNLEFVDVQGTGVSDRALRSLKQRLPKLK